MQVNRIKNDGLQVDSDDGKHELLLWRWPAPLADAGSSPQVQAHCISTGSAAHCVDLKKPPARFTAAKRRHAPVGAHRPRTNSLRLIDLGQRTQLCDRLLQLCLLPAGSPIGRCHLGARVRKYLRQLQWLQRLLLQQFYERLRPVH